MATRGYDQATGQVYEETQVPVTSMVSTLPYRCTGHKQNPEDYKHPGPGTASLFNTAMRTCAWHIDSFTPSDLQSADWHFSKMIYNHLQKQKTLTPNAWSLFQEAFPEEKELTHNYQIPIPARHGDYALELFSVSEWLIPLPFAHIVTLNIQGLCLRFAHLMALTTLENLGVLLLRHPHGNFPQDLDDRSMRDWGRAVREKNAFTRLRVVGVHHFAPSLQATLKCLEEFPALRWCTVEPFRSVPSRGHAERWIKKLRLPFEVVGRGEGEEDSGEERVMGMGDPDEVWSRGRVSVYEKMTLLYNLSHDSEHPPPPHDSTNPAFLSVHYGQERSFSYSAFPLWFRRKRGAEALPDLFTVLPEKHGLESSGGAASVGGGEVKKRRIREGRKNDIGSVLGGFG